jgi:4-diphosphocytidyl-2-C-methyl-D-erythritol kinase
MRPRRVRLLCPAKLNLFLEVLGRRPDGFHELVTVMTPIDVFDTLEVREARGFRLEVEGAALRGTNTVEKAYRAVARRYRLPGVRARLVKRIPAGSGLGGGSSDAAAMIEALDGLFGLGLDREAVGAEVGSDVNFFFHRRAAVCTGRGETVAPLAAAPRLHAVVFWPGVSLATADVYARVREFLTRSRRDVIDFLNTFGREDLGPLGRALFNRLESPAFSLRPELAAHLARLRKLPVAGARMTGSGSALYALCASRDEARRLARRLEGGPGAWVVAASSLKGESSWRSPKSASS